MVDKDPNNILDMQDPATKKRLLEEILNREEDSTREQKVRLNGEGSRFNGNSGIGNTGGKRSIPVGALLVGVLVLSIVFSLIIAMQVAPSKSVVSTLEEQMLVVDQNLSNISENIEDLRDWNSTIDTSLSTKASQYSVQEVQGSLDALVIPDIDGIEDTLVDINTTLGTQTTVLTEINSKLTDQEARLVVLETNPPNGGGGSEGSTSSTVTVTKYFTTPLKNAGTYTFTFDVNNTGSTTLDTFLVVEFTPNTTSSSVNTGNTMLTSSELIFGVGTFVPGSGANCSLIRFKASITVPSGAVVSVNADLDLDYNASWSVWSVSALLEN